MKICGIKLTHDAGVAGIENGKLVFGVELEKISNNPRYTSMTTGGVIQDILNQFGFEPDVFVVDGWKCSDINGLNVASYHEFDGISTDLLDGIKSPGGLKVGDRDVPYFSYPHMTSHIVGSYCCSPYAKAGEDCYCISWDGGQNPRVHRVSANGQIAFHANLFMLYGIIYSIMGWYFGPYKRDGIELEEVTAEKKLFGRYDIPGKLMSYIANGQVCKELLPFMDEAYRKVVALRKADPNYEILNYNQDGIMEHEWLRIIADYVKLHGNLSDASVLHTIHEWLKLRLVADAVAAIPEGSNLIFTGGSALNIKWNTALRSSGHFKHVFVPPFPNDAGSAIGTACAHMWEHEGKTILDWGVYSGPELIMNDPLPGWWVCHMSLDGVAHFLKDNPSTPIVFLHGRAELGPRALGHRSILCSASMPENKVHLNNIKKREQFRPVAPICMEEHAPTVFDPGTPDPYMLFDHQVRDPWQKIVPAIVHIDNSARLQTINKDECPVVHEVLRCYWQLTGIPLLCNTSANLNGFGFFPDLQSAMSWEGADHIWVDGQFFERIK